LQASAAEAQYDPAAGTLRLAGTDAGGSPRVADAQIDIDAQAIDVTLQGRNMAARGNVQTVLRTGATPAGGATRLPGLLQQGQPANVSGNTLDYQGSAQKAIYKGNAVLWQGETAIRADTITLDQARGDLLASGNARSNLMLENGTSIGRAVDIRYDDATRTVTYVSPPPPQPAAPVVAATSAPVATTPGAPVPPVTGAAVTPPAAGTATPKPVAPAPAGAGTPVAPPIAAPGTVAPLAPGTVAPLAPGTVAPLFPPSQLSGPQGDLRATRLEVVLARAGSRAERLEAYGAVVMRLDTRVATGDRLTYFADEERYVVTGLPTVNVKIVEDCRETSGRTVTFFKSTERIIVDGNEQVRTQSKRGGPCPAPGAR
jgi:lipopolysaccharide export system protein LptA